MYKVSEIAKWFIARNKADYEMGYTDELITNLKLQKLLYYAQGCVLALTDEPLFDEDIQAWEHGPVVPEIYHKYKSYGKSGIDLDEPFDEGVIDEETRNILESVYNEFGQYSAWKLRNMTHEETPWKETMKNEVISKESIKKYFAAHYIEQ